MGKFDDLERLQKLKESGVLTNQEFENAKQRILNEADNVEPEKSIKSENLQNEVITEEKTEKEVKNKKTIKIFIIIVIIVLVLIVGLYLISSAIEKSREVSVPNLIGKTYAQARDELSKLDLYIESKYSYNSTYSDSDDAIIQTQDDEEGEIVKKGDTIKVTAKTQEQIEKEKEEEEERKRQQEEAEANGYRSSPASESTIIACAKTLINNTLRSSSTARWGTCEMIDEDNYGRCLVYVTLEAQNGFGAYNKLDYLVVLQYVQADGNFTYKPYSYSYQLSTFGGVSVYNYYITTYKDGTVYPVIQTFLDNNDWNTRPADA